MKHISKISIIGLLIVSLLVVFSCANDGQEYDGEMTKEDKLDVSAKELKLQNLMRTSLETFKNGEVMVSMVEIPPDTVLQRHYHPGEEFIYVLEGSGTMWLKNKPDTVLKKGDVFKVPYKQVHTAKTGSEGVRALVFRVHEKGKPERVVVE